MKKSLIFAGLIIILVLGGIFYSNNNQSYSLIGEEIWTPKYFTAECVVRAENNAQRVITSHTDTPTWYSCTTDESGTYIPLVNGIQCEYEVSDISSVTAYICNINGGTAPIDEDDSRCEKITGFFDITDDTNTFVVNAGDYLYLDTDTIFGDATLKARYPSYGLRVRGADNFVSPTTQTCEINSLSTQYHTTDAGDRTEVLPNSPFNAVSALEKTISTQSVTLDDVEGGREIYITRPNYYYLIKEADDGFKYVDTGSDERRDTDIECIPRTTGCSDDAKIVPLEDQPCDKYGGAITNYAPVTGDSTRLCKYSCEKVTLSLTGDCIAVAQDCPEDKPLWDTATGLCSAVETPQDKEQGSYTYLLYFLGALIIVGLLIRRYNLKQKGGKK